MKKNQENKMSINKWQDKLEDTNVQKSLPTELNSKQRMKKDCSISGRSKDPTSFHSTGSFDSGLPECPSYNENSCDEDYGKGGFDSRLPYYPSYDENSGLNLLKASKNTSQGEKKMLGHARGEIVHPPSLNWFKDHLHKEQFGTRGSDSGLPECPSYENAGDIDKALDMLTVSKTPNRKESKQLARAGVGAIGNLPDLGYIWGDTDKKQSGIEVIKVTEYKCAAGGSTDLAKSDENSGDEDYENARDFEGSLRENESRYLSSHEENKGTQFKIDSKEWMKCINLKTFENRAKILLLERKLPGKDTLNQICTRYNRKSQIVQLICENICTHLHQQSDKIVSIWAAYIYTKEENVSYGAEITFVIMTNKIENIHIDCDYKIFFRKFNEISIHSTRENMLIHAKEISVCLMNDEEVQLKKCIGRNTKLLMDKHSNITRITLSWFKTTGKTRSQLDTRRIPCVAIYVHIKGLIPINEDPFTKRIEQFPVDVREGVFRLHGKHTDLQKNLRTGCLFDTGYGTKSGTIGPLIQIRGDSSNYCLTSSHVVLMDSEFQRLKNKGFIHYGRSGIDVYQPPESQTDQDEKATRYPVGRVEAAIFREGNHREAGMEIALLKINDDRRPVDCNFPEGGELNVEASYETILGMSSLIDASEVWKNGGNTEFTKGRIRFDGTSVRTISFPYLESPYFTLHKQIEVISDAGTKFGDFGDSGSLVLVKINNKLVPLGIFEGSFYDGLRCYIVTPLADIIKTISETMSRYYPVNADHEDMEAEGDASVSHAIKIPLQQVHREIDNQETDTAVRLTAEVEENILFHTEHKFSIVKSELTEVKKGFNELTNELKKQNSRHEDIFLQILQRLPQNPNNQN